MFWLIQCSFFSFEKSTLHVTVIVRSVFGIFRLCPLRKLESTFYGKVIFLLVFYVRAHVHMYLGLTHSKMLIRLHVAYYTRVRFDHCKTLSNCLLSYTKADTVFQTRL